MNNIKAYLDRDALAGIAGGIAAALFQWLVTETQIRKALAIEAAREVGVHKEMSRGPPRSSGACSPPAFTEPSLG